MQDQRFWMMIQRELDQILAGIREKATGNDELSVALRNFRVGILTRDFELLRKACKEMDRFIEFTE